MVKKHVQDTVKMCIKRCTSFKVLLYARRTAS